MVMPLMYEAPVIDVILFALDNRSIAVVQADPAEDPVETR